MTTQKKDDRTRNWTIVVYPESAPENWIEILQSEQVPFAVSPLHDKDVNVDGEIKKPHWHVMLMYSGKKSFTQIKEIADKLNAPKPKNISTARMI